MSEWLKVFRTLGSWAAVLTIVLVLGTFAIAEENGDAPRGVKLTDQSIRSEKRLYRKAPEGDLYLHLYYPSDWKAGDTRPAIVLFFGGSWKVGSYLQMVPQAEYFASRGLVAAAADYRIATKHHTTPDKSIEDAKSAMRWVRSHAKELGVDPEKIIAGGGSAGGHLATATALIDEFNSEGDDMSVSCKPCALVLFNPVEDVTHLPENARLDLGDAAMRKRLSPIFGLRKDSPPMIVFFGSADERWGPQGLGFVTQAKEIGAKVELYMAPGQTHGFFNHSPWTEVTAAKADEFLASLGYLRGPPTIKLPADAPQLEKK
ncbi:MAG TPA: alpha/beta hydrolase [Lacipirellulaceae bacterium]|nr:alpha/beta hydrolase [Lacipirellulaceae bacterium]